MLEEKIVSFVDLVKDSMKINNAFPPVKIIKILMEIEYNVNVNLDLLKLSQVIIVNGVVVTTKFGKEDGTVDVFVNKTMLDMAVFAFLAH